MLTANESHGAVPVETDLSTMLPANEPSGSINDSAPGDLPVRSIEEKLRAQVEGWRRRLLDLGNRNALIKCSFDRSRGVVEIVHPSCEKVWHELVTDSEAGTVSMRLPWRRDLVPPPADWNSDTSETDEAASDSESKQSKQKPKEKEWDPPLAACLSSTRLGEDDLVTEFSDKALDRRLRTLNGYAALSLSEQGVHCLYMAFGFLKWFESIDSEEPIYSPLMLVPVSLSRRTADAPWEILEAEDDAIENRCLRERLRQDFKLALPPLPDIDQLEADQARLEYLAAVREAIAGNDRWDVVDRCVLGRFAFPKVAMWQDLGDHVTSVLSHALCRSIGGDNALSPGQVFGAADGLPEARQLDDELAPGQIKAILDCDSSQLEAVVAARRGVSFVLDGPPGTGKSQTIANIIADALAEGRKVLFVSEKVSALEVVKRRLDDAGLGEFCLECHSSKANRKAILDELKWCLDRPVEVYNDAKPKLKEAHDRRQALNNYVRSIHRAREPLGLSPFELFGRVSHLNRRDISAKTRCNLPGVSTVDPATLSRWLDMLSQAKDVANVISEHDVHPWRGCLITARTLSLTDDLKHHLSCLSRTLQSIDEATSRLVAEGLMTIPVTLGRMGDVSTLLKETLSIPDVPESWFQESTRIATAVLQRIEADGAILDRQAKLDGYVADVADCFPLAAADWLSQPSASEAMGRLRLSPPPTVRAQRESISRIRTVAAELESSTSEVASLVTSLVQRVALPLRASLPLTSIPKFAKLARSIADSLPMRAAWFDSERRTSLRHLTDESLGRIARLKQIEATCSEVSKERLGPLGRASVDIGLLRNAWAQVGPHCSTGNYSTVVQLMTTVTSATRTLHEVQLAMTAVLGCIGLPSTVSLDLSQLKALLKTAPPVFAAAPTHGSWNDAAVRSRVTSACEAAVADLTEAADIRARLEERMSHRAFKLSASDLASRGGQYSSIIRRLTGGFGAFRKEVSELYKSGVPVTKQLLSDLADLRKHHARINDCRETASELMAHLPTGHSSDDAKSWKRISEGIAAIDQLGAAVPQVSATLPETSIICDRAMADRNVELLHKATAQLERLLQGTPLQSILDQPIGIADIASQFECLHQATSSIAEGFSHTRGHFHSEPTVESWLTHLELACEYADLTAELTSSFDQHSEAMPESGDIADERTWLGVRTGVDLADKLRPLVQSTASVVDSYCGDIAVDSAAVYECADQLDAVWNRFGRALQQAQQAINLTAAGASAEEILRQTPESLLTKVRELGKRFDDRIAHLMLLEDVVRKDTDIAIEEIPRHAGLIKEIRGARSRRNSADAILASLEAENPDGLEAGGFDAAEWLAGTTVTPLSKAVATNPAVRQQVVTAHDQIRLAGSADFASAWKFLRSLFDVKTNVSTGYVPVETPVGELAERLRSLSESSSSLDEWLKFSRWQREMTAEGFADVVDELIRGRYSPSESVDVVTARFYRQLFDHLADNDPLLREFDLETHDRLRERFRELDEWEVKAAATQIRQYQLGRSDRPRPGWNIPVTSELGILQKEIQKKRRHMPLRKLFAEIPGVLQRLKPCIMMSPLSVSTFLQSETIRFDLVIFDEASQVFPWDAIGAIYRGSQLVVAGDEQQLPPTDFFSRSEGETEDEEEQDGIGDFGSILSVCKSINMPGKRLRWHYRSRREPLITFSNRHFYDGELVTFPSTRDASHDAVTLDLVPGGKWVDQKNLHEAERIADLVIAHHRNNRHASLGVIAFNRSQQRAIEDILFERRKKDPEIDALLSAGLPEPLFIKNLENVQGDERDVILLSMGFARNEAGTFSKNFGPLSRKGGQRRLNVAVTRAREQLTFVASVRAADMDLAPSMSIGAHLLKAYLEYAERGVDSLTTQVTVVDRDVESPFEAEVAAALIERGLTPVSQVGCGGFRIDLALKHPKWPGRFCLGIECDGATYHSSHTARDRDRIRQSVLEQLGWHIVRVWSTDWVRQPERQVERILKAYEQASVVTECPLPKADVSEDVDQDLQPQFVQQSARVAKTFNSIDEVSSSQIKTILSDIVRGAGATPEDDLLRLTARQLGFARTGNKIRERIEEVLHGEVRAGVLQRADDRIAMTST